MGGVDLSDQQRSYYSTSQKSYKWWKYVFYFVVDVAIVNSHILYQESPSVPMDQLNFRLKLSEELINGFCNRKRVGRVSSEVNRTPGAKHLYEKLGETIKGTRW